MTCDLKTSGKPIPVWNPTDGGTEILPSHIAKLQQLRETCRGLGVAFSDAQYAGMITLSMPTPFWDLVIRTLDSRPNDCHLQTKHGMEPETRASLNQQRPQCLPAGCGLNVAGE